MKCHLVARTLRDGIQLSEAITGDGVAKAAKPEACEREGLKRTRLLGTKLKKIPASFPAG